MIQGLIDWIINHGGIYMLLLVVFAETGLFVGFFLPGDSLLFAAGIYLDKISEAFFSAPMSLIILLVTAASVAGNMVGYWFGRRYGVRLFERQDTLLFKKKHLIRARDFYHQYGKSTIFLAKFLPIIRTFAPIVAGIVKMAPRAFTLYNILGSIVWVGSMMLGGHYLNSWVKTHYGFDLEHHIEGIAIVIILVTTLPVLYKLFLGKRAPASNEAKDLNGEV